jgi:uncharacterized repeat protein (TIGR02543 family)
MASVFLISCDPTVDSGGGKAYIVDFNVQGGESSSQPSIEVTNGSTYGTLATTTRPGYSFDGWWTEAGGSGSQITGFSTVIITSDQTLYAKWNPLSYTVTFDEWGGVASSPVNIEVTNGFEYGTLATTTRSGYTLAGWWTEAGGNGNQILETSIVNLTADQTVYAKWNPLTVTFDPQGGTNLSLSSKVVTPNTKYGTLATVERAEYTFYGWYTGIGGAGDNITQDTYVHITSDQTLYAYWLGNWHTVIFDVQGGTPLNTTQKSVRYSSTYGTLETPVNPGYDFLGWWTDSDGLEIEIDEDSIVSIASNHTLYAKWEFSAEGAVGTFVFYDKGIVSNGWRYLEAAPADVRVVNEFVTCNSALLDYATSPATYIFGIYRTTSDGDPVLVGGTQDGIGFGENNTTLLEDAMDTTAYISTDDLVQTTTIRYAAKLCHDLIYENEDDWFLPSKDELYRMYQILKINRGVSFSAGDYWSSTENSASAEIFVDFDNGGIGTLSKDHPDTHVRAIRAF